LSSFSDFTDRIYLIVLPFFFRLVLEAKPVVFMAEAQWWSFGVTLVYAINRNSFL